VNAPKPLLRPNELRPFALSLPDDVFSLRSYGPLKEFSFSLVEQHVLLSSHGSISRPEEKGFDGWSAEYADYVLQHPVKFWEYCRVLDMLQPQAGERILDVGGGSSPLSFYLASLGCEVDVADYEAVAGTRSIIGNSNQVAAERHWNLRARHADAAELPYEDSVFDAVTSISVLEHVGPLARQRLAFSEAYRVLKPGGVFGITFDYGRLRGIRGHYPVRCSADIHRLVAGSGFSVIGNGDWLDVDYTDPGVVEWERKNSRFVFRQLRRKRWYTAFSLFLRKPESCGA
jgi:SAM-dependent methyltransferase